jgi:hypothetical protein
VAHHQTQLNRRDAAPAVHNRSATFYTGEEQRRLANACTAQLNERMVFYFNPNNAYIQICDRPKIEALKQQFPKVFIDYEPTNCHAGPSYEMIVLYTIYKLRRAMKIVRGSAIWPQHTLLSVSSEPPAPAPSSKSPASGSRTLEQQGE